MSPRHHFASITGLSLLLAASAAHAQQKADPAAAQALFYEARTLMKDSKFAEACPKLEESLKLDYGIGTEFNLADCNEKLGKLATAWSGFTSVAAAARTGNQPDREKVARQRAKSLEPKLAKLSVSVPVAPAGLEVKRDGVALGPAAFSTAMPVDAGQHKITATAPGRQMWETTVSAQDGKLAAVTIPALVPILVAESPATTTQPAPAPVPVASYAPPSSHDESSPQRTAGWVVGAVGLASLAVGGGFGIHSLLQHNKSDSHCTGDLCNADGVRYRDRAITSGNIATATMIAGGAAVVGGLVLVLTAPKDRPQTGWRAAPTVGLNGGGLAIEGVFQ